MPDETPLLIHVGYHKTGTTWLQRILFKPAYGYYPLMEHQEIYDRIVRPHGLLFDPTPARSAIERRRAQGAPGGADLISSEILVGNPFHGGRESDDLARRLKAIAPNARILVTIREQLRAATSVYMQYLNRCGTVTPREFFSDDPVIGYVTFAPEHLDYHRLVKLYIELFGAENVHVMTQEALARDAVAFARELADFAGLRAPGDIAGIGSDRMSPSPPEYFAPVLRRLNHFRSGPMGPGPILNLGPMSRPAYNALGALGRTSAMKALLGRNRPVTDEVRRRFAGRYAESNRALKDLLGGRIDLSGYEI